MEERKVKRLRKGTDAKENENKDLQCSSAILELNTMNSWAVK